MYFVDYGFVENVTSSDLRVLGKNERGLPCQALCCHLADVVSAGSTDPNKWSQTACEYMKEVIGDKTLYIKRKVIIFDRNVTKV